MAETLLEQTFKGLDLGSHFKESKASLAEFIKKIEEFKILQKDPYNFINDHFSKLRNEIDIEREVAKEIIDKHFLELIEEVDEMEEECKEKAELEKGSQSEISIDVFVNKFKSFKKELDLLKIDMEHWDNVKVNSDEQIYGLKRFIKERERELLLNNSQRLHNNLRIEILEVISKVKIETEKVRIFFKKSNHFCFFNILIDFFFILASKS